MVRNNLSAAFLGWAILLLGFGDGGSLRAADQPGQADFDAATDAQLSAETLGDLERVTALAESALKKGLDEGQAKLARQLAAATLYQHAQRLSAAIFDQQPTPRWAFVRKAALEDLARAAKHDPNLPDVYLLKAKLLVFPIGKVAVTTEETLNELKQAAADARTSLDSAVRLLKEKGDPKRLAEALVLRVQVTEDEETKIADLNAAIEADPQNATARQARALHYLEKGDNDKAVADLKVVVEREQANPAALGALAEALTNLKKYDEALNLCAKVIELTPNNTFGYTLRARVHVLKDDLKKAMGDLNEALRIDDEDLAALLMRSRLYAAEEKNAQAKADVEKALQLQPDLPQAILMRSLLAAQAKNYGEAIADIQTLLRADPKNSDYLLQLASYMVADQRPRRAIAILDGIIDSEPKNSDALRSRADALLSVGKHAEAIADYETALKIEPEDTGILNNLAWVLATSTDDKVRNGKRSLELGKKACELTKHEKAHILSTLASGYAELGDFEKALEWSAKAVEKAEPDVKEQLGKELESYKQKKPWRESQNVEENTKPLERKGNDLET